MNSVKRFWLLGVIAVALLIVAVACGGDDATATPTRTTAAPTATPTTGPPAATSTPTVTLAPGGPTPTPTATLAPGAPTATATPTTAPGIVVPVGTLRVALDELGNELEDPAIVATPETGTTGAWMFNWLLGVDPGGELSTERGLASDWSVGAGAESYTFILKENVRWHDGIEFVADDVVFTFGERLVAPDAICTLCGQLRNAIDQVVALDDHTVEFKLKQRDITFFANVGVRDTNHWLIPRRNFRLKDDGGYEQIGDAIGTNVWKFVGRKFGESLSMEANEDYWNKDKYPPQWAEATIFLRPEPAIRLASVRTGEIDFATILPLQVPEARDAGLQVDRIERFAVNVIAWRAPYDPAFADTMGNQDFREALTLSLDLEAMAIAIYPEGLREIGITHMWDPPAAIGHDPTIPRYVFDEDRARAALARSGYDGRPLKVWVYTLSIIPEWPDIVQLAAAFWENIGINTEIEQIDFTSFLDRELPAQHTLGSEGLAGHIGMDGWPARPTALNNIAVGWISLEAGGVLRNYHDPAAMDLLYNDARESTTFEELNEKVKVINRFAHDTYAGIPFVVVHNWYALGPAIESWNPGDLGFGYEYETLVRAK